MGRRALGKRKALEEVDPRTAQAGSPIALALFDLLADTTSTLRSLLRVSDLFCVRLTCKEAWRCIQHRPLTRLGVLNEASDWRGFEHHVPLLRWCLRQGIMGIDLDVDFAVTIGQTGDSELVSEVKEIEPKSEEVMVDLLCGATQAGHDELALQLWAEVVKMPEYDRRRYWIMYRVASGGCIRTAAAINDDPTAWIEHVVPALHSGHLPFVEWVLADVEPDENAQYVVEAAKSGSLELVKWLYTKGYAVRGEAMTNAAASGNVDLCKWVLDLGLVPDQSTIEAAVEWGHVQVLEWLSGMGCMCTSELLRHAVRIGGVPAVAWCLEHHSHAPDAGDLLILSCESIRGTDVFEYLTDQRGFQSSPTELMRAAAKNGGRLVVGGFDATVLVKRYGVPLYPGFIREAIVLEDLARIRCALVQGQEVSKDCYEELIQNADATLLNEVLLARKVGDRIPKADRELIKEVLRDVDCSPNAKMMLADHSFFV
jgi:hypothetical protein